MRLCVAEMQQSQKGIIANSSFNLSDSMSCVELTDTKTDPYCMSKFKPIEILVADGIFESIFDGTNCLKFIKKMLLSELTWFDGGSPPESLLYSAFHHKKVLDSLKTQNNPFSNMLYAVSIAGLRICHCARRFIVTCDIYEDDDFSASNFHYMADDIEEEDIISLLQTSLVAILPSVDQSLHSQFELIVQFREKMLRLMKSLVIFKVEFSL